MAFWCAACVAAFWVVRTAYKSSSGKQESGSLAGNDAGGSCSIFLDIVLY